MNLIEASTNANHCQRNWVSDQIQEEHLNTIIECSKNMPSKQNVNCYTILVSQNQDFNNFCYKHALHKNSYKKVNRNSQLIAPTLFLWIEPEENNDSWEHFNYAERDIAVGISGGVASFVSNYLGYKTGFCRCFESEKILKELHKKFNIRSNNIFLMLGIGKPNTNFNHNEVVIDNQVVRSVETIQNKTKVLKIS